MPRKGTAFRICIRCGADFLTTQSRVDAGKGLYCSTACRWPGTPEERFWAKVNKDGPVLRPELGPCWIWTGCKDNHGYGQLQFRGRLRRAHVAAYILTTGHEPPPETPKITHLCDGGDLGCVRPSHLLADTQAGNLAGMRDRGRSATGDRSGSRKYPELRARGERNGHAKLTDAAVVDIRTRYAAGGILQRDLAAEYGVSRSLIGFIAQGKGWPHLS